MTATTDTKGNPFVAMLLAVLLGYGLYEALTGTDGEYPPPFWPWVELGLDAALTVVLAMLAVVLGRGPKGGLVALAIVLAVLGVLAGLAQIGIRLSSDDSWWTGHLAR